MRISILNFNVIHYIFKNITTARVYSDRTVAMLQAVTAAAAAAVVVVAAVASLTANARF